MFILNWFLYFFLVSIQHLSQIWPMVHPWKPFLIEQLSLAQLTRSVMAACSDQRCGRWNHTETPRTLGREPTSVHTDAPSLFTLQSGETLPENLCLHHNLIKSALNRCLCLLYLLIRATGGIGIWGRALRRTCQSKTCLLSLFLCKLWSCHQGCGPCWFLLSVQGRRSKGSKYKLSSKI